MNLKTPFDYILEGRDSQNFGSTDGTGQLPNSNTAMIFNGNGQYRDFGTTVITIFLNLIIIITKIIINIKI